jgi:mannosyl-3-phosphoglycerate phosphatase
MTPSIPLVVFTDLDGTLLDHATYGWDAAQPALDRLARLGAPVILASSKTAAEIIPIQHLMGLTGLPAIVENGAGLVGLGGDLSDNSDYTQLRRALDDLPADLRAGFRGFADMDLQEVVTLTGLDMQAAARAQTRAYSEPGLWQGDAESRGAFLTALKAQGVTARQGGRFLTLSFGKTKAERMDEVIARYRPARTLALGDAPNDVEMLERADIGVIVANPHHPPLPPLTGEDKGRILRTDTPGPEGWNLAVLALLDRFHPETCPTPSQDKGPRHHG